MIFGGVKFLDEVLEDSGCTDVTLEIPNCNTTSVDDMDTFSGVMFQLYRITLGQDYDKDVLILNFLCENTLTPSIFK